MGTSLIHARNEQPHTKRPSGMPLCALLALVRDIDHQTLHSHRRLVDIFVLEALRAHVLAQRACVCCEPRNSDPL